MKARARRRRSYATSHDGHIGAVSPDLRILLCIPPPTQDEVASHVGNLDFINNGPHVAFLEPTEQGLAVALWAGNLLC